MPVSLSGCVKLRKRIYDLFLVVFRLRHVNVTAPMKVCMDPQVRYAGGGVWSRAHDAGPLTDKKIQGYENRGFYNADVKRARAEWRDRHRLRRQLNDVAYSNFITGDDGRLIYAPR